MGTDVPYFDSLAQGMGYASVPHPTSDDGDTSGINTNMDTVPYREPAPFSVAAVSIATAKQDAVVNTVGSNVRTGLGDTAFTDGPRGLDNGF